LRLLACCLIGTTAVAISQQEDASRCLNKDLVSLVQGGVQIHRHEVNFPSISNIIDTVEGALDEAGVIKVATSKIIADPLVRILNVLDTQLKNLDGLVETMWSKAAASTTKLANSINRFLNVSTDGVTDSAAVNMALNEAVEAIEDVTSTWNRIANAIDSMAKVVLNDLSTVGFQDVAQTMSDALDSAMKPIFKISDKLLEVKAALQKGAQPWRSNAETDPPLEEALGALNEVVDVGVDGKSFQELLDSGKLALADLESSKVEWLMDWFRRIIEKIDEVSKQTLAAEQAGRISMALSPLEVDVLMLLAHLIGGLFTFGEKFEVELRTVKAITAKAAGALRSAAMEPRSLSMVVGALALVGLVPIVA